MPVGRFRAGYRAIAGTSGIYVPGYFSGGYAQKVLGISPENLIAYWPLNETSGTNADNSEGTAARDGTYTGVSLNNSTGPDGQPVGLWDGTNDYCNIYTVSFRDAFNGSQGTFAIWFKVNGAGVWTDGSVRHILNIKVNGTNLVSVRKDAANNDLRWQYSAGGTAETRIKNGVSSTDWIYLALTWDKAGDAVKMYYNGVQEGATFTGIGVWVGLPASIQTIVGAGTTAPATVTSGYVAHPAVWTTPLTPAQIASLAVV